MQQPDDRGVLERPVSVIYSILSAEALGAEVARAYGLNGLLSCDLLQRGLNATYLVRTEQSQYVARVYGADWRSSTSVAWELDLVEHLAAKGVPVARPVRDERGSFVQRLRASEGIRQLVVFRYVDGKPLSWADLDQCALAGRLLATVHCASDDFVSRRPRLRLDLPYLIDKQLELLRPFLDDRPTTRSALEGVARRLRERAREVVFGLDWGVCLGDLSSETVRLHDDGIATIVDFDLAATGWLAYDLAAVAPISYSRREPAIWEAFLEGYSSKRKLTRADLSAVPVFDLLRRLWSLGYEARRALALGSYHLDRDLLEPEVAFLCAREAEHLRSRERRVAEEDGMNVHEPAERRPEHRPAPTPLPVTYSILSSDALGRKIVEEFDMPTEVSCELVRPGSNDTYLVRASRAEYVARVYGSRWRSLSEISYEVDLLIHLASRGVHVSLPIPGRDGARIRAVAAPEGLRYLVLFTRAPGKPLAWVDEDQCALAGEMAAAIHRATDDFVSEHERFRLDLSYLIDASLSALRPFLAHRSADWLYVEQLAGKLRESALAAIAGGLDWGVCHSDLGNQNIYVSDEGALTVIDFDLAGPGWRAYDFVAAQWLSSYESNSHVWQAFLDGYTRVRSLGPADLAAVDVFHGISRLWTVGLDARNAPRWGTLPMSDYYLDSYLRSLREWEQEFGGGA
jgi:Ser/Thr protein kinase RdoA (MazF antagonist)